MKRLVLSLSILTLSASAVFADDLDQFRQREQLLGQKWTRDVASALESAARLERNNPAAARETLQSTLGQVKAAPGLSDAMRADLSRRLQSRLSSMPVTAVPPRPLTAPQPGGVAAVGGTTPLPATFPGSTQPANPPAAGPADVARNFFDRQKSSVAKSSETRDNRASGFNGVFTGIQNSSVPTDRDMAFNAAHKDIAARRTTALNPKEEAVMTALGSTIEGDFTGMNFRAALDYIHQKTGLVIIPDAQSMKEANVDYDDPVNFKIAAKISVRTALRKILGDRGLSYIVSEGGINVVTVQRARETTVVRVYNVRDLVTPAIPQPQFIVGPYGNLVPVAPGVFPPGTPGVTPSFAQTMGATISEMVRTSVDPNYWAPAGPGTVTFNEATGSLIVRASAEVHFMVGGALNRR
ncbi:MAG: hypothetical protein WCL32_13750 [Planctomycetota bacterium]